MNTTKNHLIQKLLLSKKGKKQNSFTLIELMVVIAIVGILSGVGLPQLLKSQDRAKDSAASATLVNAAKECSMDLIAGELTPTTFETKGYLDEDDATRIVGTCQIQAGETDADALSIFSESGNGETTEFEVTFTGAIPNPVGLKTEEAPGG